MVEILGIGRSPDGVKILYLFQVTFATVVVETSRALALARFNATRSPEVEDSPSIIGDLYHLRAPSSLTAPSIVDAKEAAPHACLGMLTLDSDSERCG
jgi:hypothetical protein